MLCYFLCFTITISNERVRFTEMIKRNGQIISPVAARPIRHRPALRALLWLACCGWWAGEQLARMPHTQLKYGQTKLIFQWLYETVLAAEVTVSCVHDCSETRHRPTGRL